MRDFDPTAGEYAGHDAIHLTTRRYDITAIATSVIGGAIGDDSADDAAAAQERATNASNARLEKQYTQTREDLAPYRNLGSGAVSALSRYLGISAPALTRSQIRQQLINSGAYMRAPSNAQGPIDSTRGTGADGQEQWGYQNAVRLAASAGDGGPLRGFMAGVPAQQQGSTSTGGEYDEAALNAEIERIWAEQEAERAAAENDPSYGLLLRDFTGKDLENEPGYQFGLKEGQRAIDNRAAAGGRYFSGAALKEAARYGADYAGTKFDNAFNRDAAAKRQKYDFLSGAVTSGQNAAAMTGSAGSQMAGQVGANTTALGNAQGAAAIAGGNAITGAIQNGVNGYQQNKLIEAINAGNRGWVSTPTNRYLTGNYGSGD